MPELPEVQTTVNGLNATVKGRKVVDVWTSYKSAYHANKDNVKDPKFFKSFKKVVVGKKILNAERRAKNILIHLSGEHTILIHMKMTGHVMYGKYRLVKNVWTPIGDGPLRDPFNAYIRLVFTLDNGKHLVLSDMRRFAKVTVFETDKLLETLHLSSLGPEPLDKSFKYPHFKSQLLKRPKAPIKQALMDQSLISGIGNIYSDEILWRADVHPKSITGKLPGKNFHLMFNAMKEVLNKGIDFGGDSMSDYRNIHGEKGEFQNHHQAYRRTGRPCTKRNCKGVMERTVVATRSTHFCPVHQKLFK